VRLRWWVLIVVLTAAAIGGWQVDKWRRTPPEIPFARVERQAITSSVPTNGKVEPEEWAQARAERSGAVQDILIQRGQQVSKGDVLVRLDASDARQERDAAQAKIDQIRAELQTISSGGRSSDQAAIAGELNKANLDLQHAQEVYAADVRLLAKGGETAENTRRDKDAVESLKQQIKSLEDRKAALVAPADRSSAEARLRDANAALQLANAHIEQTVVRAPVNGEVYQFDLKKGAYLTPGDTVAFIGQLSRVHVTVYVDERDLGRVRKGMPVNITWDALPGRMWKGEVDRTPTQVIPLGSRQVGEVVCLIANPDRDLPPGANVNADIRAEAVDNALIIPKEAVRREGGHEGVFVLDGDKLAWRNVKLGVNNTTLTQVDGLQDGDAVALNTERALKAGMQVTAAFP
jgi:HlyD family secretion protein